MKERLKKKSFSVVIVVMFLAFVALCNITKTSGVALVKNPVCCSLRCPYHANVMKTLDANNSSIV